MVGSILSYSQRLNGIIPEKKQQKIVKNFVL